MLDSPLDDEEAQLLARLAELRAEKQRAAMRANEERAEREAIVYTSLTEGINEAAIMMAQEMYLRNLPEVEVKVLKVIKSPVSTKLYLRSNYRADLVSYFGTLASRRYDGYHNIIDAADFRKLQTEIVLGIIPKIVIKYDGDTEDAIAHDKSSALYSISISNKFYIVACTSDVSPADFCNGIPGKRWDANQKGWYIPLSEGWRLFGAANQIDGLAETSGTVKWTDEALAAATESAEARLRVIDIQTNKSTLDETHYNDIDAMFVEPYKPRPFQRAGIAFAEATKLRYLNCDEMGLGKTSQQLAVATRMRARLRATKNDPEYNPVVIVVCPANLVSNWLVEIKKFLGEEGIQLSGRYPDNHTLGLMARRKYTFFVMSYDSLRWNEEVITTEDDLMPDGTTQKVIHKREWWPWLDMLEIIHPEFVIADEIHYAKNVDAAQSKALRRLASACDGFAGLSGTPIVNRVDELWPLLNCVAPDVYNSLTRFCSSYSYDGRFPRNITELHELLKPIMIRRYKRDVVQDLPEIVHIERFHTLSKKAKRLYDKVLQGLYTVLADWNPDEAGDEKKVPNVLVQIMRLKQVCAIDKIDATASFAVELYDSAPEDEPNKKVLIFTQFVPIANAIARRLGGEAVVMTGQVSENDRRKAEHAFQNDPSIHFLVASAVAKEGLNLTMGRHVIFNDLFWTPKDFMQMIGRCYGRISNSHGASAYYMIANPTIEDWIMDLLEVKLQIIGQVVDGIEVTGDQSVVKDLLRKLKSELRK